MRKAGIFGQGKGRHCVTGAGTLQHQRQQPDSPHLRGKLHAAAQRKVGHKVAAQPDHGERAAVRVLEDIELFLGITIAAKGIAGIGVTIQMDAARDPDRDQAKARRAHHGGQRQAGAHVPQCAAQHPHQREGTERIAHVFLVPVKLRHRHSREHGKCHGDRLQNCHGRFPPL